MANRDRNRHQPIAAVVVAAIAALISGCAAEGVPTPVQITAHPMAVAGRQGPPDPAKSVDVLAVCLAPLAEENVGVVSGRKVVARDLAQSVADTLVDLSDLDVAFVTHVAASEEEFATTIAPVKMTIIKAYLSSVYESKSAVVVLRIEHAGKVENFRGQNTGMNWGSSPEEMSAALRKALRQALQRARPHLTAIAAGQ